MSTSSFAGYNAEVELIAVPASRGSTDGTYGNRRYNLSFAGRATRVQGFFNATTLPGETSTRSLRLEPPDDSSAQLSPGLTFDVRADDVLVARGRILRCWFGCAPGYGVRTLSLEEFRVNALPRLLQVFRYPLPTPDEYRFYDFAHPFQPTVVQRGIIDCAGPFRAEHIQAFARAAHAVGDTGLYLYASELGLSADALEEYPACYFSMSTILEVEAIVEFYHANTSPLLGKAAFSATGLWGAWSTDMDGAIVGGSPAFMAHVYAELGTTEERSAQGFFDGYEGNLWLTDHLAEVKPGRCPWIPELLAHLYGDEKAVRYISAAEHKP